MTQPRKRLSPSHHCHKTPLTTTTWILCLYHVLCNCSSLSTTEITTRKKIASSPLLPSIPRVSAKDFDPNIHYFQNNYETPVIIESVLPPKDCERLMNRLVQECGSSMIDLQRRQKENTKMYHCSFSKALDLVMQSKHGDSLFAFCEGLIDSGSQEELQKTKEALFPESTCWFEHFPPRAKPSDCIILAGEGATSTLHRDPFEWTGTSICLEGTKVWRFVPPPGATASSSRQKRDDRSNVHIIDQALDAYRLDSIAWGDGDGNDENDITISAGWQSDLSLFAQRDNTIPGARILAEIEEEQGEEAKLRFIASAAINTGMLYPDDNLDVPTTPWAGVQKPGDLIVIPAYWWHQTYATEPSLAVASQRCGTERDARRVARHLLETATRELNKDRILPVDNIIKDNCTPKAVVDELFRYLQSIKI